MCVCVCVCVLVPPITGNLIGNQIKIEGFIVRRWIKEWDKAFTEMKRWIDEVSEVLLLFL